MDVQSNMHIGCLDGLHGLFARGWCRTLADPEARVELEILVDDKPVGTVRADKYRADLEQAEHGDGRYAFSFCLPAGTLDGQSHKLSVRTRHGHVELRGSPMTFRRAFPACVLDEDGPMDANGGILPPGTSIIDIPISRRDLRYCSRYLDLHPVLASNLDFSADEHFQRYGQHEGRLDPREIMVEGPLEAHGPALHLLQHGEIVAREIKRTEAGVEVIVKAWAILAGKGDVEASLTYFDVLVPTEASIACIELGDFDVLLVHARSRHWPLQALEARAIGLRLTNTSADVALAGTPPCRDIAGVTVESHPRGAVVHANGWVPEAQSGSFKLLYVVGDTTEEVVVAPDPRGREGMGKWPGGVDFPVFHWAARIDCGQFPPGVIEFGLSILWKDSPQIARFGPFSVIVPEPFSYPTSRASEKRWLAREASLALLVEPWCDGASWLEAMDDWGCVGLFNSLEDLETAILGLGTSQIIVVLPRSATPPRADTFGAVVRSFLDSDETYDLAVPALSVEQSTDHGGRCVLIRWETLKSLAREQTGTLFQRLTDQPLVVLVEHPPLIVHVDHVGVGLSPREWLVVRGWVSTVGPGPVTFELRTRAGVIAPDVELSKRPDLWKAHPGHSRDLSSGFEIAVPWHKLPAGTVGVTLRCEANALVGDVDLGSIATPPIIYGIESTRKGGRDGKVQAQVIGWALAHDGSSVQLAATDGSAVRAMELLRVSREDVVGHTEGFGRLDCGFAATADIDRLDGSRVSIVFRCTSGYVESPPLDWSLASVGVEHWVGDPAWSGDRQTFDVAGYVASTEADVRCVSLVSGGAVLERAFPVLSTSVLHAPSSSQPMQAYCGFRLQADLSPYSARTQPLKLTALIGDEEILLEEFDLATTRQEGPRRAGLQAGLDFPPDGEGIPEDTKLRVAGWAFSHRGHNLAIEVYSGGQLVAAEMPKLRRMDVVDAFKLPDEATPGFDFTIEKQLVPGEELALDFACRNLVTGAALDLGRRQVFGTAVSPMSGRRMSRWLEANAVTRRSRQDAVEVMGGWRLSPLISILMPHYQAKPQWLDRALESLEAQWYRRFELCLADDGSTDPAALANLEAAVGAYPWVRLTCLPENQGISAATNAAASLASGEFVLLLDQDDELAPNCLFEMVKRINAEPDVDIIYSDCDKIDTFGRRFDLTFKPDFDPDMLLSYMYMNQALLIRRTLFEAVGGFRPGFEGSQDHDLALRLVEKTDKIAHVPVVLYHWRVHTGSTALSGNEKPASFGAAERAIRDALDRRGLAYSAVRRPEWAERSGVGVYRVTWDPRESPLVSIIIPTRNRKDLLERCIQSIEDKSTYSRYEIIVVDDRSEEAESLGYLANLKHKVVRVDDVGQDFNFSALVNVGVEASEGEFLVILNNDTEVLSPDWMEEMLGWATQPGVGVVGCRLLFPGGHTVQHAGLVRRPEDRFIGHVFRGDPAYSGGYSGWARIARGVSGVTFAAAMVPRSVYAELAGLDEVNFPVAYQDPDFCLRARSKGLRVVYSGHAELIHAESLSKPRKFKDAADRLRFWVRWSDTDPMFNPNLALVGEAVAPTDRRVLLTAPEARVRVAALVHNLKRQGAPTSQLLILRELATSHGFEIHVIVTGTGPLLAEYAAFAKSIKMSTGEAPRASVASWLHGVAPDVVYGNTLDAEWFITLAIDEGFSPFWNIRESALPAVFFRDRPESRVAAELALVQSGRLGFVSHATARLFSESGLPLGPMRVIENGVDLEHFSPSESRSLAVLRQEQIPSNAIIVGTVGTVCARKAQHLAVRAFIELQKVNLKRPLWFLSVGEMPLAGQPYRNLLESVVRESPRPERIVFLPESGEISELYRCFDIFVSMSLEESFPRVVIEAMASGLPVVAADVFGVAEQVIDGTTGFTVTPGDVAAMAERLELLLNDAERRKLLGRQGRWVAERLFGMERMVAAYAREFRLLREQAG